VDRGCRFSLGARPSPPAGGAGGAAGSAASSLLLDVPVRSLPFHVWLVNNYGMKPQISNLKSQLSTLNSQNYELKLWNEIMKQNY
jgi:hypothetical protein